MNIKLDNFLRSGWIFDDDEYTLKSKIHIINLMFLGNILGLSVGITINIIQKIEGFILLESIILCITFLMIYFLRVSKKYVTLFSQIISFQYLLLFSLLVYIGDPLNMKHAWIYTYPLILLNLQSNKKSMFWITLFIFILLVAPFQPFIDVKYSVMQVFYLLLVLSIVSFITYFYQFQMTQAREIITAQRLALERKYKELSKKDSMLTAQSKQAVMGEMMSMIAHQWRQPLSTVTLNISNIQFKKMLGQEVSDEDLDKALSEISDTVVYLSDTVDDFQTFFHPKKEITVIEIHELLQKAVNFATPRTKESGIEINVNKYIEIEVVTYVNELVQIMLNILNNAIDALEQAKKERSKIIIYVELKGEYIYISIVDNANGISNEVADRIFDPYFSTKGKNGTGLGLYMSQMLAQKQFDGDITFTSSNLGTHFLVKVKKDVSS